MNEESTRMSDFLTDLLKPIVNHPDDIQINPVERGNTVVLELHVNPEDMGKVIGRGGKRAEALRTVLKAQALRLRRRVILDIVD